MLTKAVATSVAMLALGSPHVTGTVRADVDGDGHRDAVSLTPTAHGFVLRVRTRRRVVTRAQHLWRSSDPRILALRPVNSRRGLEIMVLVDHGAANDFIVFYTLSGERLLPMTGGPHDPADPPIVWDVGGTVGVGFSEADCISHGHVGVIIRWPDKHGRWHAKGTRYSVERTRFVRTDVYELASERIPDRLPSDWPQVRRPEFESCGGITLPRQ